jgi:hypothetical protein
MRHKQVSKNFKYNRIAEKIQQKKEGKDNLKNKLPTLSKKDKANGKMIKQVV